MTTEKSEKPSIIVLEDDPNLLEIMTDHLSADFAVTPLSTIAVARKKIFSSNQYQVLLLDLKLPDGNGMQLLEEIREAGNKIPVIIVTGNEHEATKIKAFDLLEADDYIVKPFSLQELTSRLRVILRHTKDQVRTSDASVFDESPFQFLGATVNPSQLEVKFPSGTATAACRRTLGIMQYMAAHPNVVVTRKALLHAVWGVHANPRSRSLDQYIVKVRQMFISHGLDASAFRTVHSVGYFYRQQECPGPLVRG